MPHLHFSAILTIVWRIHARLCRFCVLFFFISVFFFHYLEIFTFQGFFLIVDFDVHYLFIYPILCVCVNACAALFR